MFNMLFQMSPPHADFVNEKTDYVAGQVANHISQAASGATELFARATVDVSHRDQEIRELKEKDVDALFPFRPANLPALVKSFCSSEDVVAPLLQALHQDPVGLQALQRVTAWGYHRGKYVMQESLHRALADNVEDWEYVRTLLPEQVPPPGLEPFSDPPVENSNENQNKMARFLVLFALCSLAAAAAIATATVSDKPFLVKGKVYLDTCNCGFETTATKYLPKSHVRLECKKRDSDAVTYTANAVTNSQGEYSILVNGDRGDDLCDLVLVKSSDPLSGKPDSGRDRARVILSRNNGLVNDVRFANNLGFTTKQPLASCAQVVAQYHLNDDNF
nr:protein DOWNSTREAM OF FLC-like [Ipomoea batatas]